tara:strand:- start:9979 stop:11307 length:1329 start_codon:yes stop_codon:yes gene_type:complete
MNNTKVKSSILYIVHCIDTEGPLYESIPETIKRFNEIYGKNLKPTADNLKKIQNLEINLNGKEASAAKCFSPHLLKYNENWEEVDQMLDKILSAKFRESLIDDFGGSWVYSWHCLDHLGFKKNPRKKSIGYGKIYKHYKSKLKETKSIRDEINWHFHPLSIKREPLAAATSYNNNFDLLNYVLARRIIDDDYFPTVNRPGFHSERTDSNVFLESWIPFDYANQFYEYDDDQPDMANHRFGDWSRAPKTWRGYNPSFHDYQTPGNFNRLIFRCLNIGTRIRCIKASHIDEAFLEAKNEGSAILSFANHDYRDMTNDLNELKNIISQIRIKYPDVKICFAGAEEAAIKHLNYEEKDKLDIALSINKNIITVEIKSGEIFGSQPFLAIKDKKNNYYHDNFDVVINRKKWIYVLDNQTINKKSIKTIAIGSAGKYGKYVTKKIELS